MAASGTAGSFTRWPFWRRWFGQRSERVAARHLRTLGYRIVARNASDRLGELDLIAIDIDTIVIVEVRSTESSDLERTAASVDLRKQRKLTEAALRFLAARRLLTQNVRFDVLLISWPATSKTPRIVHHRHAFEATGKFQMWS